MYYDAVQISTVNDFIFCPHSIYLHSVYKSFNQDSYHKTWQKRGRISHKTIDTKSYSTKKDIIQSLSVYSLKYNVVGKIDIFNTKEKELIERKYLINKIYDGYKYQIYLQFLCMVEMGYNVSKLTIYSLSNNKKYKIPLPINKDLILLESLLNNIRKYYPKKPKVVNKNKCENCVYNNLCVYSKC